MASVFWATVPGLRQRDGIMIGKGTKKSLSCRKQAIDGGERAFLAIT